MGNTTKIFVRLHYILYLGQHYTDVCQVKSEKEADQLALKKQACYAYTVIRREDVDKNGETHKGEEKVCKRAVFGKVYTLEEIERMEDTEYLVKGMEKLDLDKAVKTRTGEWLVWQEDWEYISK